MKIKVWQKRLSMLFLAALVSFLAIGTAIAKETIVYNKYNIHVQIQADRRGNQQQSASYANYTNPGAGHRIISPGTPLVVERVTRKAIIFKVEEDGSRIHFEYHEPRMGISPKKYLELITSPQPVSLAAFSKIDQKGIKEGKASPGMTREGVMTALGYPAPHRTPSLDSNSWVYWTNRFGSIAVEFDDGGKVVTVRN